MISKHVRGPVGSTAGRHRGRSRSDLPPAFSPEPLERRVFMDVSLTAETLVNASKLRANQIDTTIAVDPTNTNRVFSASSMFTGRDPDPTDPPPIPRELNPFGYLFSLSGATSTDGGATWATRRMATGPVVGGDNPP